MADQSSYFVAQQLLKKIIDDISNGNFQDAFLLILTAAIGLIFTFGFRFYKHRLERHDKDMEIKISLVNSNILDVGTSEAIKEGISKIIFKKSYGIYADYQRRLALIEFMKAHQLVVSWHQTRQAAKYLIVDNHKNIHVEVPQADRISYFFLLAASAFYFFSGVLVLAIAILFQFGANQIFAKLVLSGAIFVVTGALLSTLNFPLQSANKIKKILEQTADEESKKDLDDIEDHD
jgi:hypothetical protein